DEGGTIMVWHAANYSGGTLTGGNWQATGNSTLRLLGANITTNAANLLLDGSGSHLYQDGGTTRARANLAANGAAGSITVRHGAELAVAPSFTNAGAVNIGGGSTLSISPASLVAYWPADNDAADLTGENLGQLRGGATFATGQVDQAFDFNGTTA